MLLPIASVLAVFLSAASCQSTAIERCNALPDLLASSNLTSNTTIWSSTYIDKGSANVSTTYNAFPFCKVTAQQSYGANHTLNFQVWLPDTKTYQSRFVAVGNGGMAGVIDTAALMLQMNKGFAVAGGDAGHLAADNNGGSGAPNTYLPYLHDTEEVTAWIHDGISLFTQPAKTIIATFYSEAAQYSYYVGCSTGGAQGFALAQFHPDLFDGIVAGSPGNFYSHLALSFLWNARVTQGNSYISQDKLNIITAAVLDECDALDGVTDGVLENPLACTFNISSLTCQGGSNSSTCLTALQVEAAQAIYAGPQYDNGSFIYPGFDLGSEKEWAQQEASNESLSNAFAVPILQNLVYNNLSYNASTFDFQTDVPAVDQNAGMYIDEITTNLTTFASRGSKMLVTQGWADPYNAATWPIIHLEGIIDQFGGSRNAVSDFLNLFMIPGGGHCGAASNYPQVPATYHTIEKMVEWVERGRKPDWVLSTDPPEGNATKLLCPWPQTAAFVGGDASWWGSYVCEG